jgi:hypothetical protein
MEQQTLSIAKAGIICQLNARTSILAAANPSESQWNKNKTIVENIMLPHTLMSRWVDSGSGNSAYINIHRNNWPFLEYPEDLAAVCVFLYLWL